MTTRLENGTITVPEEVLTKAGLEEGDELYVGLGDHGSLIVERTRLFDSGEEFLAHLRDEHEALVEAGR